MRLHDHKSSLPPVFEGLPRLSIPSFLSGIFVPEAKMSLARTRTNGRLIKHCSFLRTVILSPIERFAAISIGYIWFFPNNFPRSRLRRDCTLPPSFLLARRLTSLERGNKFILSTSTSLHFSQPFPASNWYSFLGCKTRSKIPWSSLSLNLFAFFPF